jgi:hypothetical protein
MIRGGDTGSRRGPEKHRCECEPINGKLEGQKAAAFGALQQS